MVKNSELLRIFNILKNPEKFSRATKRNNETDMFRIINDMTGWFANDPRRSYRGYVQLKDEFVQRTFMNILRNMHNIRVVHDFNRVYFVTLLNIPILNNCRCSIVGYNTDSEEFTVKHKHHKYFGIKVDNMKVSSLKSAKMASRTLAEKRDITLPDELYNSVVKVVYRNHSTIIILFRGKIYLASPSWFGFNNLHSYITCIIESSIKQVLKYKKRYEDANALSLKDVVVDGNGVDVLDRYSHINGIGGDLDRNSTNSEYWESIWGDVE